MRQIKEVPQFYKDYLKKEKPSVWDVFSLQVELNKQIAKDEQFEVDAYTQQRLSSKQRLIDHYYKRSLFPELTFDYNNFFVANHNVKYGADYKDNHVKKIDYTNMYNPALSMDKFIFLESGEIYPKIKDDKLAIKSIEIFNLNDDRLISRRYGLFKSALSLNKYLDSKEVLKTLKFELHSGVKDVLN